MVVHPAPGGDPERWSTPCWHMRMTFQELAGSEAGIVHRLDKDTSGLMVVAKNDAHTSRFRRRYRPRPRAHLPAILWAFQNLQQAEIDAL